MGSPMSGCQIGMTAKFYDLSMGQAQTLSTQFPFIHGPGSLLDNLPLTEAMIVPQMNFAPEPVKDLGNYSDGCND